MYHCLSSLAGSFQKIGLMAFIVIFGCNMPNKTTKSEEAKEVVANNDDGYKPMFDGNTLNGWDGDTTYWRMENGILVGETTPSTLLTVNTFIIWRAGVTADFELKTDFNITSEGNSGIQYRSVEVPGIPHALKGYQADIDGKNTYTGLNYEERGRTFLAKRGESRKIETGKEPELVKAIGTEDSLRSLIKVNDWNEYHLIAHGNHMQQYINGVLMSEVVDNDTVNRKMSGLLGLQAHVGPPMKVQFRNLRIKQE
ncbi:MAG: DUF1080 domain-containing protein [Flavitalea sp.]